jgi:hypothetical protein
MAPRHNLDEIHSKTIDTLATLLCCQWPLTWHHCYDSMRMLQWPADGYHVGSGSMKTPVPSDYPNSCTYMENST